MSQLFGKWTIKSHIEVLPWFDDWKIEIIKRLHQDRKNKLLDDESRYEQTFNQIFFWELLWYQDMINRIPKWWVLGWGIADLTIWDFVDWKYEPENVQIVCELKWAKTNLTKKQFWHGWLSAVGQGFAYKTWLKNCKRLIVSNFYEIRLYRDNTTDFEIRNLDELLDPKDNYFNLRKLYLLLHRDNLLTGKTEKLLSHFREEQQKITKKFYQEYKELRIRLIQDIRKNNPNLSVTTSVEKAQKIIDRLIFIFFCEDKGLLPDKKLKEWIVRAWEFDISPREMTKRFFTGVDSGSEKLWIPDWYNGWLFKEDHILNSLRISDDICNDFVWLTNYNFEDDISVNILWHIFEQSISDLEEIKEDLIWRETQDNSKWRRKKDWIFYTPEYIVDYIVQNSVMKYLNEKEDECLSEVSTIDEKTGERRRKKNIENPEQKAYLKYQQILQNIKVLDPACWSGAFLVRVFDVLLEENERIGKILKSLWIKWLFDDTTLYKNILTNNIYWVDLNEESVEITKLSLRLKSAQKWKKLNNLDGNIKCGNSLIDDPFVAKEKAFDWNVQFKEIMKNWWFDVIVGNPPYVSTKAINTVDRNYFRSKYSDILFSEMDLYEIFIYVSTRFLLKDNWYLSFITPNSFYTNKSFYKLRKFIFEETHLIEIIDFPYRFFPFTEVNTETTITVYNKIKYKDDLKTFLKIVDKTQLSNNWVITNNSFKKINIVEQKIFNDVLDGNIVLDIDNIILKILSNKCNFKKYISLHKWWMSIPTETIVNDFKYPTWIFSKTDLDNDQKLIKICNKYIEWRDTHRYYIDPVEKYVNISWIDDKTKKWHFSEKIILQRIVGQNINKIFASLDCSNNIVFPNANIINIMEGVIDIRVILWIINSKLISYFYNSYYWESNTNITKDAIESIPIPDKMLIDQKRFIEHVDKILLLTKELHELTDKFLHRIQDNLKIEKLTKKLESFYKWEFKDFLDELKKQKISLSLSDQDDREPYFKEYKEKVLVVKGEIERTDKEIDEMVFDLYGLSEDERRVVLGG